MRIWTAKGYRDVTVCGDKPQYIAVPGLVSAALYRRIKTEFESDRASDIPNRLYGAFIKPDGDAA